MALQNTKHLPLQELQKIYPNSVFWFENISSGNTSRGNIFQNQRQLST
jgi:hypothetical protein